jgi:hypothetical protein
MIHFGAVETLARAQTTLDSTARRIAQQGPSAEDAVQLIAVRQQFAAGIRLAQAEDDLTKKILDVLA